TFLSISFDAENDWIYGNWIGSQTQENVRLGANAYLEILTEYHCSYLINDNRLVAGPWSQAMEWLITNWLPRAIAGGLTHFAQVISPEPLARLSAENLSHRLSRYIQVQTFEEIQKAQEWLKQAQQVKR
ncbi:MAG: hypothetical protein M3Q05_13290, partial [Bacteroidota bacterium]|nr:hypothetical protein [Bacteroidota bacterium]